MQVETSGSAYILLGLRMHVTNEENQGSFLLDTFLDKITLSYYLGPH